jgi:hypothetical protein
MAPETAAFFELTSQLGQFFKFVPRWMNGSNWLNASVSWVVGVDDAAARLCATKGIKEVRDLAHASPYWVQQGFSPEAAKALAAAQKSLIEVARKYDFQP